MCLREGTGRWTVMSSARRLAEGRNNLRTWRINGRKGREDVGHYGYTFYSPSLNTWARHYAAALWWTFEPPLAPPPPPPPPPPPESPSVRLQARWCRESVLVWHTAEQSQAQYKCFVCIHAGGFCRTFVPLRHISIRGTCTSAGEGQTNTYHYLMTCLKTNWRRVWKPEFWFGFTASAM